MDLNDPYYHPIPHVRRFERMKTWIAAFISLLIVAFFVGFFVAYGWTFFRSLGFEGDTARMIIKSLCAAVGFGLLTAVWPLASMTAFGGWLERYTIIALREFNRH